MILNFFNFQFSIFNPFGVVRSALVTFFLLGLSACTYAYIPPIPPSQPREPILDLRGSEGLFLEDKLLRLHLKLAEVPVEDWLAVQWFNPANDVASSDSLLINPADVGSDVVMTMPLSVELIEGNWRAIVFYKSRVFRQFSFEVLPVEN